MAALQQNEIPSGEGLTLKKLWAYLHASSERFTQAIEEERKQREAERKLREEKIAADQKLRDEKIAEDQKRFDERMEKERKQLAETMENDRIRFEQSMREWAEIRELQKQANKQLKKNEKLVGDMSNSFGELIEHIVAPGIARRFTELGFAFENALPGPTIWNDDKSKARAQVDLILENGDTVIAVEVKARPKKKHIEHHINRLYMLKEHRLAKGEKPKRILGAIAGAIFPPALKDSVHDAGFFVIEQSGDTLNLNIPTGFVPREW